MTTTTPQDLDAEIAELEYRNHRHVENLDGLREMDAHLAAELSRLDAKVARLASYRSNLPASADAATVHEGAQLLIDAELARGLLDEERTRLAVELAATPGMIKDNLKALKKLKAKASSA